MVCSGGLLLVKAWMHDVVRLRRDFGIEVVWVTSGAIASAAERTRPHRKLAALKKTLPQKQALSAIGQPIVMDLYNTAIQACGALGAQILLTASDLKDQERRSNFVNATEQLLRWGVVPILNENDAVATEEIQFGDNDRLSAQVASVLGADRLVILTDVDGLYDGDPKKRGSRLVESVGSVTAKIMSYCTGGKSQRGTGGMYSKLLAARLAQQAGIDTHLVRGDRAGVLVTVAQQKKTGTHVHANKRR